ncbi:MAG: M15 family metallopeptidase [Chitinophagaceae bacterium]|nr:M15 family metallopeptidase [Chitinophagaceae bacterium]
MTSFFTEFISHDPRFNSTTRISDFQLLETQMQQKVQSIIDDAKAHGIDLMVYETYRSQARQELLFNQKASKLKKVGVHHYGLACDIVKNINGEPSWKGDFSILGTLAHAYGLIWGGDWGQPKLKHSFMDLDHVQLCTVARQAALFRGEWYPAGDYDPYKELK